MNHYIDVNPYLIREQIHTEATRCVSKSSCARSTSCAAPPDYLPWSSVTGSLSQKRGTISNILVDGTIGRLISPGHRLRTTSPESIVQDSPEQVEQRRYGHCGE